MKLNLTFMNKIQYNISVLTILALIYTLATNAQTIAPQSINNAGSKMVQSTSSISFTVGELVVGNQTNNTGGSLGSGFIGSATITTSSILEPNVNQLDVKIFPNPTVETLNIQVNYTLSQSLFISIHDSYGKEVYFGRYAGLANTIIINMSMYQAGIYILSIRATDNQPMASYKIIKN